MTDRRSFITACASASLGAGLISATPALAAPKVGKPAPHFDASTFGGKTIKWSEMKNKVILLNYWATWCGPCRIELPLIQSYVRNKASPDLLVFAITTEDSVPDNLLKPLAKVLSFPLVHAISSWSYGIIDNSVPSNYVIDKSGILRYAMAGAFEYEGLEEVVTPLLNEDAPQDASKAIT